MKNKEEVVFVPEEEYQKEKTKAFFENFWNDIVFYSTISWFVVKGYVMWFISMGGIEIDVGYTEDGEETNYLHLEKLW